MSKKSPLKKKDSFAILAEVISNYMSEQGWDIAVLNGPRVQHRHSTLKYNYELVFDFTGKQK